MSAFFMPPDDLQLDQLTNATLMKLEQFRDRTATGQSHKQHMYKCQHFLIIISEPLSYFPFLGVSVYFCRLIASLKVLVYSPHWFL